MIHKEGHSLAKIQSSDTGREQQETSAMGTFPWV